MCFSPTASFTASAGLFAVGSICIWRSKALPQYVLSMIPIMLSIQQCTEGFLWLSKLQSGYSEWHDPSTYIFLVFAQIIWPFYIPFSTYLLEDEPWRKKVLFCLTVLGMLTGLYLGYGIIAYPVSTLIDGMHIKYIIGFPGANKLLVTIIYFVPTACSPFFSRNLLIKSIGVIIVCSTFFTLFLFPYYAISVWCYFAGGISLVILLIIFRKAGRIWPR